MGISKTWDTELVRSRFSYVDVINLSYLETVWPKSERFFKLTHLWNSPPIMPSSIKGSFNMKRLNKDKLCDCSPNSQKMAPLIWDRTNYVTRYVQLSTLRPRFFLYTKYCELVNAESMSWVSHFFMIGVDLIDEILKGCNCYSSNELVWIQCR